MKKNKKLYNVVYALCLLIAVITLFQRFHLQNTKTIETRNKNYALDAAYQKAGQIEGELQNGLDLINNFTYFLNSSLDQPTISKTMLQNFQSHFFFDTMVFTDINGINHTSDGRTSDATNRDYYINGIKGQSGISIIFNSVLFEDANICFYAPVYYDGEIIGVLRGMYLAESYLRKILVATYFGEKASVHLCTSDGMVFGCSDTDKHRDVNLIDAFVEEGVISESIAAKTREVFKNGGEGAFVCDSESKIDNICVMYLPGSDYVLVQTFPKSVTHDMVSEANLSGLQLEAALVTLFIAYIIIMLFQAAKSRKYLEKENMEQKSANEAKRKFLARMSHEIRTPINAVLGMDEMILRESKEQQTKEYAMDIYMAGQTLLSIINDILDFSKIESGKMEIVPIEYDICSLIHDISNMTLQRAAAKNIKLEVDIDRTIPSRLYGDDVRIRQILMNILTNAVKYTKEGTVWLRITGKEAGETAILKFEVEDTGIGIKEEDLPKLTAEFERIEEERNRNIEGSGLGMNITIQLLALLGSKLQVESVYGKGSKFYFELEQPIIDHTPIGDFESRVHQTAENYSYITKLYAPDAKILVVDDNAVNRKVFRNLLKKTQIQVADAESGAECLELIQKYHYDLIFLDHMMPEMDGIETFRHIKEFSDYPCKDTPIVMLTADAISGSREKYLSEGFDEFLSKPIAPEKLENMIQAMLPKDLLKEVSVDSKTVQQAGMGIPDDKLEKLPQIDGLDWEYAWMHLPDMELLEFTVKEFYAQIGFSAAHLEQEYAQITEPLHLDQYRICVHAMKSLAATIGILPLSGLARLLEFAAKDGKIDVIQSMTAIFLEEWRSYHEKLKGVFGIGEESKKEVADYSIIQALVEMVKISMQEMDIDQADRLMGQLQAYEYPKEMEFNIQKLAESVINLDPEEAARLAGLLIAQMERQDNTIVTGE